jgi:hypothetical protein
MIESYEQINSMVDERSLRVLEEIPGLKAFMVFAARFGE